MIFTSYDQKQIFVREWMDVKDPIGVVQIAHGMNEYAARYDKFARALNALGYIVVADDHRGHGDTDTDTLGYCEGDMFTDTLKDMAGIAKYYGEKFPKVKYVLFGFSYGSFLTQGRSLREVRGKTARRFGRVACLRKSAVRSRGRMLLRNLSTMSCSAVTIKRSAAKNFPG